MSRNIKNSKTSNIYVPFSISYDSNGSNLYKADIPNQILRWKMVCFLIALLGQFGNLLLERGSGTKERTKGTSFASKQVDVMVFGYVKYIYSEKATKFCEIFPLLLTSVHTVKSKGRFRKVLWPSQNI